MNFIYRSLLLGLIATVGFATSAKAEVVATFEGSSPAQVVNTTAFGSTINGMPVGKFNYTLVSSTDPNITGSFYSFCADYFQPVNVGETYTYQSVAFTDLPNVGNNPLKAGRIQELFDRYYSIATDAENGGAFQLALWELLFDGDSATTPSLSSGDFTASGSASSIGVANSWLATIDDPNADAPTESLQLVGLYNGNFQDQITVANPIPAPAGVVLLVIGAGAMLARRKFAKKATAEDVVA